MTKPTHRLGAVLAGAFVALATDASALSAGVLLLGAYAFAMVPDRDRVLDSGPNHRSITHSLVFAGGFFTLLAFLAVWAFGFTGGEAVPAIPGHLADPSGAGLAPLVGTFAVGGAAGYVSHLLLDSLTGKRIWLFFRGGPRFGLPIFRTGEFGETLFALLLVALLGCALFALVAV